VPDDKLDALSEVKLAPDIDPSAALHVPVVTVPTAVSELEVTVAGRNVPDK
jgi:hypothetical protein